MQHLISDTALICEGGGMRAAYTGGMASVLIERGVTFPYITGVSAGTTIVVCFIMRNIPRMHRSFVELASDPNFIGMRHLLHGRGYFNAHYIYEEAFFDDDLVQRNWETFKTSGIDCALAAYNAETGAMRYWQQADLATYGDLCRVCRASSSLPLIMPTTYIDGQPYVDGGVREGFILQPAIDAGYERFVILPTHTRGYRRQPSKSLPLTRQLYRNFPKVVEALETRAEHYNQQMAQIEQLERDGRALVLYPDDMPIQRTEHDPAALEATWQLGRAQAERHFDQWLAWMQQP